MSCLRGKGAACSPRSPRSSFGPAYGTAVLPVDPAQAVRRGRVLPVPVLSGSTHDEARLTTMIVELLAGPVTAERYRPCCAPRSGRRGRRHRADYPDAGSDPGLAFATMDTDRVFACPQLRTDRALSVQPERTGSSSPTPTPRR